MGDSCTDYDTSSVAHYFVACLLGAEIKHTLQLLQKLIITFTKHLNNDKICAVRGLRLLHLFREPPPHAR